MSVDKQLLEALTELYAVVRGECPSLLNEDSGGDAELCMKIDAAIAKAEDEVDVETRWIEIKEGCEMPEVGERVLVWHSRSEAEHFARYSPLGYPEFPWRDQFNSGDGPSITHWQHRPAPPVTKLEVEYQGKDK